MAMLNGIHVICLNQSQKWLKLRYALSVAIPSLCIIALRIRHAGFSQYQQQFNEF